MAAALECWNCGASLDDLPRPITRHNNCPKCFNDLHCCRLCVHFRPGDPTPCDEDRADPPVEKEIANFCDYFRPAGKAYRAGGNEKQSEARSKLDALFGSGETGDEAGRGEGHRETTPQSTEQSREDAAKAKLDALFGNDGNERSPAGED